jgi:outer membrane receptor for ferrienterochelin and colicin
LHLIRQSEVVRGPAGSRHGNAAGGVLSFFTINNNSDKSSISIQHGSLGSIKIYRIILPSLDR